MFRSKSLYAILGLALLVATSGSMAAAVTDTNQPIHLKADRVVLLEKVGRSRYSGNVELSQGRLILFADEMTMHKRGERLDYFEAQGKPARFRRDPTPTEGRIDGEALTIEYHTLEHIVILRGKARLTQTGDTFTGDEIIYNTESEVVNAKGKDSVDNGDGRVHVIIQPKTEGEAQ